MWLNAIYYTVISLLAVQSINGITSPVQPYTNYTYSIELQSGVADLWWSVNETQQDILFELHINTTGWVALGISPAGGMTGADVGLGWVDQSGQMHFEDRYAITFAQPMVDNTTIDWFGLRGREENGWTAIQFRRALDTCDTMDVPIKSGTDILIFAYGLEDPDMSQPGGTIKYHDNRRGTRMIPLRSYGNPPSEEKFAGLDYFDFQLNNYAVPSNDTTYYCTVYRVPKNITQRRHAIAYNTMVNPENRDIVHHLLMYECNPTATFDDSNLPVGLCDDMYPQIASCVSNIASGWAVGGDAIVEFPDNTGYPVGGDFEIKYYVIQMHYNNQKRESGRRDSTGIRFYLGNQLRQHELGYLTLGTQSFYLALTIPPRADRFIVDAYCSANATSLLPTSGITVVAAFPHTHLQGHSVWTKIIRNGTAVDYLFNGEAYDFNYQFQNIFHKPIQLYPGDALATRCIYSTTNKNETTLGGERTKDEMCLHMFTYYPRMNNLYGCSTMISEAAWQDMMDKTDPSLNFTTLPDWLMKRDWTPELIVQWQEFYNKSSLLQVSGKADNFTLEFIPELPKYQDLKPPKCKHGIPSGNSSESLTFPHFDFNFNSDEKNPFVKKIKSR